MQEDELKQVVATMLMLSPDQVGAHTSLASLDNSLGEAKLRLAMKRETELFFETVLREDRSILEFQSADWTLVNEALARHYGIPLADAGEKESKRQRDVPSFHESLRIGDVRQCERILG